MKILILGGNRFFGKKLAARLLTAGHQITLLNRGQLNDGFGSRARRLTCDRKNKKQLKNCLEGSTWDLVYDQICYTSKEAAEAMEIFKGRVGHYVFTSSQSVYAEGVDLSESAFDPFTYSFTKPVDEVSNYPEAKRQSEKQFFSDPAFPVTAVRFPIVVGADDYTGRFKFHVESILKNREMYFPNPLARISFISSDEAALVLEFLSNKEALGPVNAASKDPIQLKDFIHELEKHLLKKALWASEPTSANQSPYGISKDWFMNTDKLNKLGCHPRAIAEWLSDELP